MPLTVISRRSVVYRESGSGEMTVLLVPGRDQIQVVKDLAGLGKADIPVRDPNAQGKQVQVRKQAQLSRVYIGRRYIYGNLPNEISDLRQPVKVWLAEDYAPTQSQAFFYVFSSTVVIHGVREQDDEGQQSWRTAQLLLGEGDPVKNIIDAISDYALANSTETLTVAVLNKLDLYEKLQAGLATYNISPVPFSKLKPQPGVKPLYRHRDYTILYLTFALLGLITVLASGAYAFFTMLERDKLAEEVKDVQHRIESIKLNQNVGQVTDPQSVLQAMSRGINQQMSAILHAAGEVGEQLGKMEKVRLMFEGGDYEGIPVEGVGEGQQVALVRLLEMKKELLLDQELDATQIVATHPWVRGIMRGGAVGESGVIAVVLQVDQTAEMRAAATAPLPEAQPAPQPEASAPNPDAATATEAPAATVPEGPSATQPVASTFAPVPAVQASATVQPEGLVSTSAPSTGGSFQPAAQPQTQPVSATLPAAAPAVSATQPKVQEAAQ